MKKYLIAFLSVGLLLPAWALAQNHPNSLPISRVQETPLEYPFSFVVMGDTRFPGRRHFAALRDQIAQLDPAPLFVIDVGVLVMLGFDVEYLEYLEDIDDYEIPFISVIGNHEMYAPGGLANYRKYFGEEDFFFDYKPCRFIAMNNANPWKLTYGVSQEQLGWLEDKLAPQVPPL